MTEVQICNLALAILGIPTITSFDDTTQQAKQCKNLYPILRDRVLRDHTWSFAATGATLQQTPESSFDPAFQHVCALPVDLIRIIELENDMPYRRVGKKILVNELNLKILYIKKVEDSEQFDPLFCEALQYLLAAEFCMTNTRDAGMANSYRQEYQNRLAAARSIDSAENRAAYQCNRESSFLNARRGFGGSYRAIGGATVGDCGVQ